VLQRTVELVIGAGIVRKEIPPHRNWRKCKWGYGAHVTADVGHETQAQLSKINAGVAAPSTMVEEDGEDFEELIERIASDIRHMQAVAGETKVPMELLAPRLSQATQMLAAANAPAQEEQPPAGRVHEVGEKAAKEIVELLVEVAGGQLPRESAVLTLVDVYGYDQETAEKMVPAGGEAVPRPGPEDGQPGGWSGEVPR